ncbi:hypothetical protein H4R34_000992 [Dimargaris verticillata]|uniref:Chitin-binding type-2 domain-containing protein n=1 Tax=Dimargaris verticillata TaxID=2761393 RepID=A0A9W8EE71_9FUNG|nr:hypothetical protein H4R34_000992 [Dimargaris verticillata]
MLLWLWLPGGTARPQATVVVTETASPMSPITGEPTATTTVWWTDTTLETDSPTDVATATLLTTAELEEVTASPTLETITETWPTATMTTPEITETTTPEVESPVIAIPPVITVPTQVPGGCVSGEFRCDSENPTLFYKCNFNQWIRFECAPGTFCQPFGQFILCGFGHFSSAATKTEI